MQKWNKGRRLAMLDREFEQYLVYRNLGLSAVDAIRRLMLEQTPAFFDISLDDISDMLRKEAEKEKYLAVNTQNRRDFLDALFLVRLEKEGLVEISGDLVRLTLKGWLEIFPKLLWPYAVVKFYILKLVGWSGQRMRFMRMGDTPSLRRRLCLL